MANLQTRLKEYRVKNGLTQVQISEILEMTYQEYQKIEGGKTNIRVDKLIHICRRLNLSSDWLLGMKEKEN